MFCNYEIDKSRSHLWKESEPGMTEIGSTGCDQAQIAERCGSKLAAPKVACNQDTETTTISEPSKFID